MMYLYPEYYAVNSSPQLGMESWKCPRKMKKQAQWMEWFLCEEKQNILGIFSLGKRWSLITSWMVMGSWGKRLIIIPDNVRTRADEISWVFKKGTLHHPACGEVVQVMATGYYGDQNNKWVQKLVGQFGRGQGHQFLLKIVSRMKPQMFLCQQKLWERGGPSVPAFLWVFFTWASLSNHRAWSQVKLCFLVWQLCSSVMLLKFMIDIYFYAFPHLPSLPQVGGLNVFVCLSLTALPDGREAAQSPHTKGLLTQAESAGMGKVLRGWQPPSSSSSSHSWCPGARAMQTLPCQHFSCQPSRACCPWAASNSYE